MDPICEDFEQQQEPDVIHVSDIKTSLGRLVA